MSNTERVPVKVYRWDDVGAPQVESAAGSLKTILKACLVSGYGEDENRKEGLGWEMAFEKTQEACFRSTHPKATQWWLGVDDSVYDQSSNLYAVFTGILEPTSAKSGRFVQHANHRRGDASEFNYIPKYGRDNNLRWILVGNPRGFILTLLNPGRETWCPYIYFGDFTTFAVADAHHAMLMIGTSLGERYFRRSEVYSVTTAMRSYKGLDAYYYGLNAALPDMGEYPNPITNGFTGSELYIMETINDKPVARGVVPGIMKTSERMPGEHVVPFGTIYDNLDDSGDKWMYIKSFESNAGMLINLTAWQV